MEEVIRRATLLGELIRRNPRFTELRAAERVVQSDPQARETLRKLNDQVLKLARKEHDQQPIEVEDKRELACLKQEAASNPVLKRLAKAQADFAEMMNHVNAAIRSKLTQETEESTASEP
ncbi:MAG: YlbF family regulator [Planctomycetota bacterium]